MSEHTVTPRAFVTRSSSGDGDESLSWCRGDQRPCRHDARTGRVLGAAGRAGVRSGISNAVLFEDFKAILGSAVDLGSPPQQPAAYSVAKEALLRTCQAPSLVAWRGPCARGQ